MDLPELRSYQSECLAEIARRGPGRWLVQMATGMGKTFTFARIPRYGRTLILSHREELTEQPIKYYDCPVGIERAQHRAGNEPVVSASIQTMSRRLDRFRPDEFELIIVDEAHHAAASTWRKTLDHFSPAARVIGFTATPNRFDGVQLADIFDDIIYEYPLRRGIEDGWLAPVHALRVDVGYDLTEVRTRAGDFAAGELERAVNIDAANHAIAEAVSRLGEPPVLIFCAGVAHAQALAAMIPGAVAVTGTTEDRADILASKPDVICNCQIFTEGTDLPWIRTIAMARPTQSPALYEQMAGRGLRQHPGKTRCTLIDFVGASRLGFCEAPSLLGIDVSEVPPEYRDEIQGDLLADLPDLIEQRMDTPAAWIRNVRIVELWAVQNKIDRRGINWFHHPDGKLTVHMPERKWLRVTAPDLLGDCYLESSGGGRIGPMLQQRAIDRAATVLERDAEEYRAIWDLRCFGRWAKLPATDKQLKLIHRRMKKYTPPESLTRGEASLILNRLCNAR